MKIAERTCGFLKSNGERCNKPTGSKTFSYCKECGKIYKRSRRKKPEDRMQYGPEKKAALLVHERRIRENEAIWLEGETGSCPYRVKDVEVMAPPRYYELKRDGYRIAYKIDAGTAMYLTPYGNVWRARLTQITWDEEIEIERQDIPAKLLTMPAHGANG